MPITAHLAMATGEARPDPPGFALVFEQLAHAAGVVRVGIFGHCISNYMLISLHFHFRGAVSEFEPFIGVSG